MHGRWCRSRLTRSLGGDACELLKMGATINAWRRARQQLPAYADVHGTLIGEPGKERVAIRLDADLLARFRNR